jgi:hypothetical protein
MGGTRMLFTKLHMPLYDNALKVTDETDPMYGLMKGFQHTSNVSLTLPDLGETSLSKFSWKLQATKTAEEIVSLMDESKFNRIDETQPHGPDNRVFKTVVVNDFGHLPLGEVFSDSDIRKLMKERRHKEWREYFQPETQPKNLLWANEEHISLEDMMGGHQAPERDQANSGGYTWH